MQPFCFNLTVLYHDQALVGFAATLRLMRGKFLTPAKATLWKSWILRRKTPGLS